MLFICKTFLFLIGFLNIVNGFIEEFEYKDDFHSSITAFEKIFKTESNILENLKDYIQKSEDKIATIKSSLLSFRNKSSVTFDNPFLDTFNMFLGMQSLIQNKKIIEKTLYDSAGNDLIKTITEFREKQPYPTDKDLLGVTLGIYRLQDFYDMIPHDIANGMLFGERYNLELSSSDCHHIGFKLHYELHYKYAKLWFQEALDKFENETGIFKAPVPKVTILDYLSYSTYLSDNQNITNVEIAIKYVKEAIALEPTYEWLRNNLKLFQDQYEYLSKEKKYSTILSEFEAESKILRQVCRGNLTKTPREQRHLYCRYENTNHPFLKLAPFKVEIANIAPYVAIFHDMLYDTEILKIQELSMNLLYRAGVWNQLEGRGVASNVRTSKFAWLKNESMPILQTLNQRLSDMTGLTMETAEPLQVMNYGIGGHYDVHADSFPEPDETTKPYGFFEWGNRMATILIYMSDVEQGGGTVYPWIKTKVSPKKGSAAFWMNGFLSGSDDKRSRHSGCPVIAGSKWVANKWIRYNGQMFRKTCKLHDDKTEFNFKQKLYQIDRNIPVDILN